MVSSAVLKNTLAHQSFALINMYNDSAGYIGISQYDCLGRRCCFEPTEENVSKLMQWYVYDMYRYIHIVTFFCIRGCHGASLKTEPAQLHQSKTAVRAIIWYRGNLHDYIMLHAYTPLILQVIWASMSLIA